MHITSLGNDPKISDMPILKYTLQGIQHSQTHSESAKPRLRLPITAGIMRRLKLVWQSQGNSFDRSMLWVVACTCFFGFLRVGEATVPAQSAFDPSIHLSIGDVSVDSQTHPRAVMLRLKALKCDPLRKGINITLGRTDGVLYPVAVLLSYIVHRNLSPGPLFRFENGSALTREAFVREVQAVLAAAGLDSSSYAGHSFRIGAAATAAAAGVQDVISTRTLGEFCIPDLRQASQIIIGKHFRAPRPVCE